MRLFSGKLRLHPLLPLLFCVPLLTGGYNGLLAAVCALIIHETGHAAAARLFGVPVSAIEITPLGGVMTLDKREELTAWPRFALAAAGPVFSLLGCCAAALIYRWNVPFPFAQRFARANFLLLIVNLLPGLPLDGGEMLRALLTPRFSPAAVTRVLTNVSGVISLALCGISLLSALRGQLMLFPLFAGLYLLYAAALERRESPVRYASALIGRRLRLAKNGVLPVEYLAAGPDTPVRALLPRLSPQRYHVICVLSPDGMERVGELDEKAFCDLALTQPDAALGDFLPKEPINANHS